MGLQATLEKTGRARDMKAARQTSRVRQAVDIAKAAIEECASMHGAAQGPRWGERKRCRRQMPEVVFNGPAGRLEGRYQPAKKRNAPIAIVLHPLPQFGGTMNNQVIYQLFYMFS